MSVFERPQLGDLIAGISVALVLVPQALAYAELAGLPPQIGLIAGTLPPIIAALFVSSPYLQTGPTALTSLMIAGALVPLAGPFTGEYVKLAALLALVVGVFRVVFGIARLGIAAYFVSQPVLIGFTTGAGILIIGSQIPTIVGVQPTGDRVMSRMLDALSDPGAWSWASIAIGVLTLVLAILGRRIHPAFPSVLAAVGVAWIVSEMIGGTVAVVGDIPSTWPAIRLDLPWGDWTSLLLPGFVIALIGFAEPSSIARTYATEDRKPWSADREFVSQGVANLVAGSTGGMAVGGSFGRSGLNRAAGARTRWSGAVTGVALLVVIQGAGLLSSVPKPALAAVVIGAVLPLVRVDKIVAMWSASKPQTITAAATLAATLVFDPRVDWAIMFGLALSIGIHLWRELEVTVDSEYSDGILRLVPHGVMWFGSVNRVEERMLAALAEHPEADTVVVDLRGIGRLDLTAARDLADMASDARTEHLDWTYVGVPPHAERLFSRVLDPPSPEPPPEA